MPAPYSLDLRERVVNAYLRGEGTYAEVAVRFGVGEASVDRWVARHRATGSVMPKRMGGDRNSKLDERGLTLLATLVADCPDMTEVELVRALSHEQICVSTSTVGRALVKLGLTRKKRRSMPRSVRANA